MADPSIHTQDEAGFISEVTYGVTPDSNPLYLGSSVRVKAIEQSNRTEVQGQGDESITFAREVRGARAFRYNLSFEMYGLAYRTLIADVMGVAAGGGKFTNTIGSFSIVTKKGPTGELKYALVNGCSPDIVKVIAAQSQPMKVEMEGPCQFAELEDTLNFAGLQNVDLSDNTWPPASPAGSVMPVVWLGGGFDASQAFKWGTDADYDNKPALTELTQVPSWSIEFRRNIAPVLGRITGADAAQYHVNLNSSPQQLQVSLDFQVPRKAFGALGLDDFEKADWNDEVVYIEAPLDDTYTFDLRNGKIRLDQSLIEGRDTELIPIRVERFSDVRW